VGKDRTEARICTDLGVKIIHEAMDRFFRNFGKPRDRHHYAAPMTIATLTTGHTNELTSIRIKSRLSGSLRPRTLHVESPRQRRNEDGFSSKRAGGFHDPRSYTMDFHLSPILSKSNI